MRLYHHPLCPFSRKVRLALAEKGLPIELVEIDPWRRDEALLERNPAAEVPVLEADGLIVADSGAICEYLEERFDDKPLLPAGVAERAEVRRLVNWFDVKLRREVTDLLWGEKLLKRLKRQGTPISEAVRAGMTNIRGHLLYVGHLYEDRRWLAGDEISLADLTAAAHFSVMDYLGDVPWQTCEPAHDWYSKIKSRPSFRPLLADRLVGIKPVGHYDDLDF